jgi:hypothetical protein
VGSKEVSKQRKGKNLRIDESFDTFLKKEGVYESVRATEIKRVLAIRLEEVVKQDNLSGLRWPAE